MAEFRLPRQLHDDDSSICTTIGAAAGQSDWSIEHRYEGDDMVLTLPDGVLTQEQFDSAVAGHVRPPAQPTQEEAFRTALQGATTLPQLKAVLLDRFGG